MNPLIVGGLFDIGKSLIARLFPDPEQRAKAEMELLTMQQSGELKRLEVQMSAIVMEAKSQDPWTSRARPSFMYVMYTMILAAIPMGVLYAFDPEAAKAIAAGMKEWLDAIPQEMWWLFGTGYLGYTAARSRDKQKILEGMK